MKEVSRKMRDTAGGTPALPFEEAASSFLPQASISNIQSRFILCAPWRPLRLGGEPFFKALTQRWNAEETCKNFPFLTFP